MVWLCHPGALCFMHLVSRRSLKKKKLRIFLTGRVTGYPSWVGLTRKKKGQVTGQPVFALGQKNRVQVRYFSGRVRKF